MREVADIFGLEPVHVDKLPEEVNQAEFFTWMQGTFEDGLANGGWNHATKTLGTGLEGPGGSNHLWEGHEWIGIKEGLKL